MTRLLLNILIILLLIACGSNPSDDEKDPEINHTHESHAEENSHDPHEDESEKPPSHNKPSTATPSAASTYDFEPDRYKYKDGYIILTWEELAKVTFEEEYHEEVEEYIWQPIFSDTLKALEGKKVMVEGFVIPIEETGDETFVVLSGLPYLQCFFCGGAGPETVIDILPKNKLKKRLTTDEKITFKGRLRLNADDLMYLNYILDDAELVK